MQNRIAGYDFARSLALFGLVVANFSRDVEKADFLNADFLHLLYNFIQTRLHSLMQGGSVAALLVLGGVGISLLAQQVRITSHAHGMADNRKRLIQRAASLLVVGICCNLIWTTNFLGFYSICIIIGALLLTVSNRWLWLLTFVFVLISVIFIFGVHGYFDYYEFILNQDVLRDTNLWTVEGIVFRLYHYGFTSILSWTIFLLIGMWLGRQEARAPKVQRNMLLGGIVVTLVAECALWLLVFGALWLPSSFYLTIILEGLDSMFRLIQPLNLFATCGTSIAIIGGSLMLTEKYPDAKWTKPFIATGRLALTLYVAYLVIGMGLLKALRILDKTLPYALGSAVIFCICAVIFSHFWTKRFERGPLEWGMRRITG